MRKQIILGLTTVLATATIAAPAMAQTPTNLISPALPAGMTTEQAANAPQIHIDTISLKQTKKGYVEADVPLYAINMRNQTVNFNLSANMKVFQPRSGFAAQSGTLGVPGNDKAYSKYTLRFAIKGKTEAQIRKNFKVTISNPTAGAIITSPVAAVS
jgi:hypothetical protein